MSKITNDGLTRSGTGCFTAAVPIWQQWASKGFNNRWASPPLQPAAIEVSATDNTAVITLHRNKALVRFKVCRGIETPLCDMAFGIVWKLCDNSYTTRSLQASKYSWPWSTWPGWPTSRFSMLFASSLANKFSVVVTRHLTDPQNSIIFRIYI